MPPAAILVIVSVLAQPPSASTTDLQQLQGRWRAEVRTPLPNRKMTVEMTNEGNRVRWPVPDLITKQERVHSATLALDETAAPRRWTLTGFQGGDSSDALPDMRAVYRLEGDRLTIRVPRSPGGPRPVEITPDTGTGPLQTVVFSRDE